MGHWRDNGIGNMAGSDDRPVEEWTLLEKLAAMCAVHVDDDPETKAAQKVAQEAFDEIELLREVAKSAARIIIANDWKQIDTAPVKPWTPQLESYYAFACMLQDDRGHVYQGWGYYTSQGHKLRWKNHIGQCFPRYWMPMPTAKVK